MAKSSPAILAMNAGELSPRLDGRTDLEKYSKGCRKLQNFLPLVQGGITNRFGTRFLMEAPNARRLVPFVFNASDAFVLVFYAQKIEFYEGHIPVISNTYTITGATKANPVVITVASTSGLSNGDSVFIDVGVGGMTQLERRRFSISNVTGTTFQLLDPQTAAPVNGTAYDTFTSGGAVNRIYSLATPFDAAGVDVDALQFAQQNDVLYMACPTHAPMKLSRFAADDWSIEEVPFEHFPFSPENLDEDSLMGWFDFGLGAIRIISTGGEFTPSMVGGYVKLREIPEAFNPEWVAKTDLDNNEYRSFQANKATWEIGDRLQYEGRVYEATRLSTGHLTGSVAPSHDSGFASDGAIDWKFINYGYGYGKIASVIDAYLATVDVVVPYPKSTLAVDKVITNLSAAVPIAVTTGAAHGWSTGDQVFFRDVPGTKGPLLNNKVFTITKVSSTVFSVNVNGVGTTGTTGNVYRVGVATDSAGTNGEIYPNLEHWSFGAWDAVRGYPRAVTFYEDRLLWAGTTANPQTVWASRPGRYEDHAEFQDDDSALTFTLSTSDPIAWMRDNSGLVIGTAGSEFSTERNAAEPLSAETVNTIRQRSQYGSRLGVAPVLVENVIVFVQSRGLKLRELAYDDTQASLVATDLTRLADHLVGLGRVREIAFCGEPFRTLWCVLEITGSANYLLGLTYEREEQVYAWHRHSFGGSFCYPVSVAVIPHPLGDQDSTLLLIQRSINGSIRQFVERIAGRIPANSIPVPSNPLEWFYADSHTFYSGASTSSLTGLFNWAGETLQVVGSGGYIGEFVVSSAGKITLPSAVTDAVIGYGIPAIASPMRLESGSQDGTAQGKIKRITGLKIRLRETGRGLYMGPTEESATEEVYIPDGALKSGDTDLLPWPGGWETDGIIVLKHDKPTPCEITSLMVRMTTQDG